MERPTPILQLIQPELILGAVACFLFLLGAVPRVWPRRLAPFLALAALVVVFIHQITLPNSAQTSYDFWNTFRVFRFAAYIQTLAAAVGIMLVLLAWPTNALATGNNALNFGSEGPEFFALMLLSITGIFLVASANDIILLFLGIELASIPTYIMVSISRPLAAAQEAGVKYFFLGAMSAAIMLLGFSYLYGTTGLLALDQIALRLHPASGAAMNTWQLLALVLLICGFAFKIAAVPMHVYAADVYQGAATPVTAFLSFVPKTSGFVALVKILQVAGGPQWLAPHTLVTLLGVLAVLTMTVGNMLGLIQQSNVKRVLAYSSIAHSGYMLVGLTALAAGYIEGLQGVLFYLAAYGLANGAAFGVLIMLPGRWGGGAESFEDIAGQGRRHVGLGLAMAVSCFSLIGLPLTIGFFGKIMLLRAAYDGGMTWLVILTVINAAISAAYYLKIVATMFLAPAPDSPEPVAATRGLAVPIAAAIAISVGGTLLFGPVFPATDILTLSSSVSTAVEGATPVSSALAP